MLGAYIKNFSKKIMDVKDAIVITNVFTEEECRDILQKDWDWHQGTWFSYHDDVSQREQGVNQTNAVSKANYMQTFGSESEGHWLQQLFKERLVKAVRVYNEKVDDFGMSIDCITPVRINRYQVGDYIDEHIDHIHSIFDGTYKGVPVISFVGVLNDDYEGGEFIMRGEKVSLKTGDVIMFPSNFMYAHEVKEVTKGTRHSIVAWGF